MRANGHGFRLVPSNPVDTPERSSATSGLGFALLCLGLVLEIFSGDLSVRYPASFIRPPNSHHLHRFTRKEGTDSSRAPEPQKTIQGVSRIHSLRRQQPARDQAISMLEEVGIQSRNMNNSKFRTLSTIWRRNRPHYSQVMDCYGATARA